MSDTGRYEGVSLHLERMKNTALMGVGVSVPRVAEDAAPAALYKETPRGPNGEVLDKEEELTPEELKAQEAQWLQPPLQGVVKERAQDRQWDWSRKLDAPVPRQAGTRQPPWGEVDVRTVVKTQVPVSLKSTALVYFESKNFSETKFKSLCFLLGIKGMKRKDYFIFNERSEDPLEAGFISMWRFVHVDAMTKYHKYYSMESEDPTRKKTRRAMVSHAVKLVQQEMKWWTEYEDEDAEEAEEQIWVNGRKNLNKLLKTDGGEHGRWGLGFGFMCESDTDKVFRLWSRPVLYPPEPKADEGDEGDEGDDSD